MKGNALSGARRERILGNYGLALCDKHLLSHELGVLNSAIEQLRKVGNGEDLNNWAIAQSNLGIALRSRFKATHDEADLEASIAAGSVSEAALEHF